MIHGYKKEEESVLPLPPMFFSLPEDIQAIVLAQKIKENRSLDMFYLFRKGFSKNPKWLNILYTAMAQALHLDIIQLSDDDDKVSPKGTERFIGKFDAYSSDLGLSLDLDFTQKELMAAMLGDPKYINSSCANRDVLVAAAVFGHDEAIKLLTLKECSKLYKTILFVNPASTMSKIIAKIDETTPNSFVIKTVDACIKFGLFDKALELIKKYDVDNKITNHSGVGATFFYLCSQWADNDSPELFELIKILYESNFSQGVGAFTTLARLDAVGQSDKVKRLLGEAKFREYKQKFEVTNRSTVEDFNLAANLNMHLGNHKHVKSILEKYGDRLSRGVLLLIAYDHVCQDKAMGKKVDSSNPWVQHMLDLINLGVESTHKELFIDPIEHLDENTHAILLEAFDNPQKDKVSSSSRRP